MKNTFIIDRARYDSYMSRDWIPEASIGGIPGYVVMYLDFFIIEETDGSATFLKNRHDHKNFMTQEEYTKFKLKYNLN